MKNITEIERKIISAQKELNELDARRSALLDGIMQLQEARELIIEGSNLSPNNKRLVNSQSSEPEKISLFRILFKGREDVYPRRFKSRRTGKTGYQPACGNEWIKGICEKPKVKCGECENREFLPLTDEVIRNHLLGMDPESMYKDDFTIGVYPLLIDETCWFITADFDKATWREDATAFLETCGLRDIPAYLERSRSGNGGHIWMFFSEPVPAILARKMTSYLLTETMENRPEIGLNSYDRLFPNQDTMPKGGFGSLIALPLQKKPREKGHSVFLNKDFIPYPDQWAFLSQIRRLNRDEVEIVVNEAERHGNILGVRVVISDERYDEPWNAPPSRRRKEPPITEPLPEQINMVLGNQIYIEKEGLPAALRNRLIRLAAFQNPEFYKAQVMRLPTYNKPRIISCCEDFSKHIGLPRGCLEEVIEMLNRLNIKTEIIDKRLVGNPIRLKFHGTLRPDQNEAAISLLSHDIGVLSATTAFGKTVIAAYMIAARGVNTLVLVHRRQLLDQWVDRLSNFLGLDPKEIGQIGGGKRKQSRIVDVALIQSLSKKGIVDDIVGFYGQLVVDECHHISARSFEIVARQCPAKYVTGLSATVTRKDGHHPIIFMQCGPVRYRVDERKQAAERPFLHKVIVRNTGFRLDANSDRDDLKIHEIYSALMNNEKRNDMIINDVITAVDRKRSPILLTERKDHLTLLAERLYPFVKNLIVLKGGMGQKQRRQAYQKLTEIPEDEERLILATGRYLGEGFDDPRLDTLFLALPVSWRGIVAQYAGRLHRLYDMKKEVVIYDYADLEVPMLTKMYKRRLAGYKNIGYKIHEP
ncbi:MAG: DEAD/DEAH box helicase [Deltaproteobacteria bacterium]|nr:DEAD/DEAH box helicase [Deltaproteobacteria bacterium]MBW1910886.1 DEAD/DEAH box helicase [Deltaproteobacteria bacterium]